MACERLDIIPELMPVVAKDEPRWSVWTTGHNSGSKAGGEMDAHLARIRCQFWQVWPEARRRKWKMAKAASALRWERLCAPRRATGGTMASSGPPFLRPIQGSDDAWRYGPIPGGSYEARSEGRRSEVRRGAEGWRGAEVVRSRGRRGAVGAAWRDGVRRGRSGCRRSRGAAARGVAVGGTA